ncbi:MAG: IS1595 family transposase [Gemmatimonadota bacterium]|nr:IS1595 family transposase [Gemmatimonadota bacterium]
MHRSHLPLRKWFVAICLMCQSKKGVSANQLKRMLGVQYKTAWHLCHRIREAMGNDSFTGSTLFGIVKGGRNHDRWEGQGRELAGQQALGGRCRRTGGQIRLERIADIKKKTIHDFRPANRPR